MFYCTIFYNIVNNLESALLEYASENKYSKEQYNCVFDTRGEIAESVTAFRNSPARSGEFTNNTRKQKDRIPLVEPSILNCI